MTTDIYGPLDPQGENRTLVEALRRATDLILAGGTLAPGEDGLSTADDLLASAMLVYRTPLIRSFAIDADAGETPTRLLRELQLKYVSHLMANVADALFDPVFLADPLFSDFLVNTHLAIMTILNTWITTCIQAERAMKGQENA